MTGTRLTCLAGRSGGEHQAANFGHEGRAGLVGLTVYAEAGFLGEALAPVVQAVAVEQLGVEGDHALNRAAFGGLLQIVHEHLAREAGPVSS